MLTKVLNSCHGHLALNLNRLCTFDLHHSPFDLFLRVVCSNITHHNDQLTNKNQRKYLARLIITFTIKIS